MNAVHLRLDARFVIEDEQRYCIREGDGADSHLRGNRGGKMKDRMMHQRRSEESEERDKRRIATTRHETSFVFTQKQP